MGKRTAVVEVRQVDIEAAITSDSGRCWVAQAIRRAIPVARNILVDLQTIRYTGRENIRRTYLTPRTVQVALVAFDQGRSDLLKPFSFTLDRVIHRVRVRGPKQKTLEGDIRVKSQGKGRRPVVEGGPEIPSTVLSSRRGRKFGLRILKEFPD